MHFRIIHSISNKVQSKYWPLIKSLQTSLLLMTGLAGYMSCRCPIFNIVELLGLTGSLFLSISGSTILNMYFDRDIDSRMERTCWRPLPAGKITPSEALRFGLIIGTIGLVWAFSINVLYGVVIALGVFIDVVVYTIWLKRRTPWSIVFGGISGGMPILAGRVLGFGSIDWVGITFSLAILFWIPTHILTFAMKYHKDYELAEIPTFSSTYGFNTTRKIIAFSSILAAFTMGASAYGISLSWGYLRLVAVLGSGLLGLAVFSAIKPSQKMNFGLFKYASIFMLGAMVMIVLDVI
jgi:protoheme IX farnesyltransferase